MQDMLGGMQGGMPRHMHTRKARARVPRPGSKGIPVRPPGGAGGLRGMAGMGSMGMGGMGVGGMPTFMRGMGGMGSMFGFDVQFSHGDDWEEGELQGKGKWQRRCCS